MELLYKADWSNDKTVAVKCKIIGVKENNNDGSLLFRVKIGNLDDTFDFGEGRFRDTVRTRDQVEKDYTAVEDVLGSIQKVLGIESKKVAAE